MTRAREWTRQPRRDRAAEDQAIVAVKRAAWAAMAAPFLLALGLLLAAARMAGWL